AFHHVAKLFLLLYLWSISTFKPPQTILLSFKIISKFNNHSSHFLISRMNYMRYSIFFKFICSYFSNCNSFNIIIKCVYQSFGFFVEKIFNLSFTRENYCVKKLIHNMLSQIIQDNKIGILI